MEVQVKIFNKSKRTIDGIGPNKMDTIDAEKAKMLKSMYGHEVEVFDIDENGDKVDLQEKVDRLESELSELKIECAGLKIEKDELTEINQMLNEEVESLKAVQLMDKPESEIDQVEPEQPKVEVEEKSGPGRPKKNK